MPAYAILDIRVTDPEAYKAYAARSGDTVAAHGGRYRVRGGAAETIEGEWEPQRIVVIEFPDVETARAWHESDDYQEILPIRLGASVSRAVIVEGYEA